MTIVPEAQIRAVALFYYWAFLEEQSAKAATIVTIAACRRRIKKGQLTEDQIPSMIVFFTNKYWEKSQRLRGKVQTQLSMEAGWIVPKDLDLGTWRQFLKDAGVEECLAVIWSGLLKFSDEQIATGLGITTGTVRYRVGKGLRQLGGILAPGGRPA